MERVMTFADRWKKIGIYLDTVMIIAYPASGFLSQRVTNSEKKKICVVFYIPFLFIHSFYFILFFWVTNKIIPTTLVYRKHVDHFDDLAAR